MTPERREEIERAAMVAYLLDDNTHLLSLGDRDELRPVVDELFEEIFPADPEERITYAEAARILGIFMVNLVRMRSTCPGFPVRGEAPRHYLLRSDLDTINKLIEQPKPTGQLSLLD